MSAAIRLGTVVLDCPDPWALGRFYAEMLGYRISEDSTDDWVDIEGPGHMLSFQRVLDHRPPEWPDGVPQQVHLDLRVDEFASTHDRVVGLGATPLQPAEPPRPEGEPGFRVYADPAGHPFCLCMC